MITYDLTQRYVKTHVLYSMQALITRSYCRQYPWEFVVLPLEVYFVLWLA